MTITNALLSKWTPVSFVALVAGLSLGVGGSGGAATAGSGGDGNGDPAGAVAHAGEAAPQHPEAPIWVEVTEQRRICQLIEHLPSYWPATVAMREEAERRLGDPALRERWRSDAGHLPSYWPAAQAMLDAAADGRSPCEE